jgi:hypothetical protein
VNVTQQQVDDLPWVDVQSSNVRRIAWTGDVGSHAVGAIWIEFLGKPEGERNRLYCYPDTDYWRFERIRDAQSVGSMRSKLLKDKPYEQLVIEETVDEQVDELVSRVEDLESKLLQVVRRLDNLQRAVEAALSEKGRTAA